MHKEVILEKIRRIYSLAKNGPSRNGNLDHKEIIQKIAQSLRPNTYVEVGVYQCDVINSILPFVKKHAYAVDVNSDSGLFLKKRNKAHFIQGTSQVCADILTRENVKIDMLFIDADHKKESVLQDFKILFPLVREDGIIFLHDGYPKNAQQTLGGYCSNCWEAIDELTRAAGDAYEMMTLPQHPGLTICRKKTKQIPWK